MRPRLRTLAALLPALFLAPLAACGGSSAAGPAGPTGPGPVAPGGRPSQLFSAPGNPWNQPVDAATVATGSGAMLTALQARGGFGGGHLQVDFSLAVLWASGAVPAAPFTPSGGYFSPDCDLLGAFPLPSGGALEGEGGYACTGGGDCHLLVVDEAARTLTEAWAADASGGRVTATCAVVWDLDTAYPADLRGDQCTSADAAGLPMSALVFDADEVAAGVIDHAIRFILPNDHMAAGVYVRPATHAGGPTGAAGLPPYGTRLRLKASTSVTGLSRSAQVVAAALKKYGMILSDGGTIALTAADDRFTTHQWADLGFDSHALFGLAVSDFEVIDTGPTIPRTNDCVRNGR